MTTAHCTKPTCYMRDTKVKTDRKTCLACGEKLSRPFEDLLDGLFGRR